MKLSYYFRSPVLSWHDLSTENQNKFDGEFEHEQKEGLFVFDDLRNELLSLDSFLTVPEEKRYHGVFPQTYFSAYFITLSRCGTEAIVSYRYC